jgi:hypothetical protein
MRRRVSAITHSALLAVVAAVEPVADGLAGGGLDRADAAQGGKRGVGGQAVGGPRELQLSPELRHLRSIRPAGTPVSTALADPW